jgi:hypothetical protein
MLDDQVAGLLPTLVYLGVLLCVSLVEVRERVAAAVGHPLGLDVAAVEHVEHGFHGSLPGLGDADGGGADLVPLHAAAETEHVVIRLAAGGLDADAEAIYLLVIDLVLRLPRLEAVHHGIGEFSAIHHLSLI